MVLCPGSLPPAFPTCTELAQALDAEIEEFSMYAMTGPSPEEIAASEVAGTGVPFVVWLSGDESTLEIHVYESSGDVEVTKALDLAGMGETPAADDVAIIARNLMGTSLYANLAEIGGEDLLEMAIAGNDQQGSSIVVSTQKPAIVEYENTPSLWFPQFVMGWSIVPYPDQNNSTRGSADAYNGLLLGLRFPFLERAWAGVSITLTQSVEQTFRYWNPRDLQRGISRVHEEQSGRAGFIDDQILVMAEAAWYPLLTDRLGIWIGGGVGLTRLSIQVIQEAGGIESADILRLTLGTSSGFQVILVPRVRIEVGVRIGGIPVTFGDENFTMRAVDASNGSYADTTFYTAGRFQMAFWIAMGFG